MATKYGRAIGGNWGDDATWSTTSGGAADTVAPTAADDCKLNAASGNVTINSGGTRSCRSLDCAGYIGTLTQNLSTDLNIGDATAGASNISLKFVSGMTFTLSSGIGGNFIFKSTSGTQQTIDFGGKTIGAGVLFNATGSNYQLQSDVNISLGSWQWTGASGTFDVNSKSITTAGSGSDGFIGAGFTYATVNLIGDGQATIRNSNTFGTLNRTGISTKTCSLLLEANQTVTGTLMLAGNSSVNRIYVMTGASFSQTRGTQRTITNTGATMTWSNVDFEDIALTTSYNASSITGLSGDCGGNSNITFTTGATQYWQKGTSDSFSTAGNWFLATNGGGGAGRVPLPQDTARFDANSVTAGSVTITQDMPRIGAVDFSGVTNTPTWVINNTNFSQYGSLTLGSTMSLTGTPSIIFVTRSSLSIVSNGKILPAIILVDAPGGTVTMADAYAIASGITVTRGTFVVNDVSGSSSTFTSSNTNTRAIYLGASTLTLSSASSAWNTTITTGLTFNPSASTIKYTSTSAVQFFGGGLTYNNLWFNHGSSTNDITIEGSNTFNDFKDDGSAAHSILFTTGTTQTLSTFTVSGSAGNLITINSTTTGTHALVKSGGGTISRDYLSIQHSVVTPINKWYAGTHSTNNQATATAGSNWIFTDAPVGQPSAKRFGGVIHVAANHQHGRSVSGW